MIGEGPTFTPTKKDVAPHVSVMELTTLCEHLSLVLVIHWSSISLSIVLPRSVPTHQLSLTPIHAVTHRCPQIESWFPLPSSITAAHIARETGRHLYFAPRTYYCSRQQAHTCISCQNYHTYGGKHPLFSQVFSRVRQDNTCISTYSRYHTSFVRSLDNPLAKPNHDPALINHWCQHESKC